MTSQMGWKQPVIGGAPSGEQLMSVDQNHTKVAAEIAFGPAKARGHGARNSSLR